MNQFFFLKYFSIILLLLAVFSKMHSAPMEDSLALRTQFSKNIRAAGDTAVRIQKKTLDSLSHILEASFHRQRVSLKTLKDSLLTSTDKVLDPKRIESITKLHIRFSENLNSYSQSRQRLMRERLQIYQHTIQDLVDAHSLCRSCKESDDFENALNTFQEKVNHSTDIFFDAASDEYENTSNALADTADILRDSLITFSETLIEDRSTELDFFNEHSNKIIASIDAKSHTTFRGRDGGVSQASVSPSLTLALSSGFRITLGAGWTEKPEFHRDGTSLGIGYDFNISPIMGASIGYSYLWFADSSTQNQSVFHHSIDGEMFLETSLANFGAGVGISIGSETEYAFTASASRHFPIGIFSLNPSLIISWGEQNGELTAQRLIKTETGQGKSQGNGKGIGNGGGQQSNQTTTTTLRNIFSIMAYEINLPLNIHIEKFIITPSLSGIFPMNVIDGSRKVPYMNAGLAVVYEWRL